MRVPHAARPFRFLPRALALALLAPFALLAPQRAHAHEYAHARGRAPVPALAHAHAHAHAQPLASVAMRAAVSPHVPASTSAGDSAPKPAAAAPAAVPALQRIAIVGASVSAGIGLDPTANPFAGQVSKLQLAQIVEASILGPHGPVHNGADFNFFSSPEGIAKRSAADAKAAKPTALVAIDYLFWLGYGPGSDEKRAARVDAGLKHLDGFTCPVLVGDLPDFRGAGTNPMYLPASSIPPAEALSAMNKRIHAWAGAKSNVVIVPMGEMLRKVIVGETFTVAGTTFEKGSKARLLQEDNLHTTLEGTCGLWALAVEAWRAADPTIPADAFLLDIPELAKKSEPAPGAEKPSKGKGKNKGKGKKTEARDAAEGTSLRMPTRAWIEPRSVGTGS